MCCAWVAIALHSLYYTILFYTILFYFKNEFENVINEFENVINEFKNVINEFENVINEFKPLVLFKKNNGLIILIYYTISIFF